jgi:hypothetical protein
MGAADCATRAKLLLDPIGARISSTRISSPALMSSIGLTGVEQLSRVPRRWSLLHCRPTGRPRASGRPSRSWSCALASYTTNSCHESRRQSNNGGDRDARMLASPARGGRSGRVVGERKLVVTASRAAHVGWPPAHEKRLGRVDMCVCRSARAVRASAVEPRPGSSVPTSAAIRMMSWTPLYRHQLAVS